MQLWFAKAHHQIPLEEKLARLWARGAPRNYGLILFCNGRAVLLALAEFLIRAVVAKLMHRSSTWLGFASVTDRPKFKAFIRRTIRANFCTPDPDYD